jgi:acyl-CoA synthetase (NDP forming)
LRQEWIDYDHDVGGELMVSLRWDREFGPVLACGPGGLQAEVLAQDLKEDRGLCLVSPRFDRGSSLSSALAATTAAKLMTTSHRQSPPRLPCETLVGTLRTLVEGAQPLLASGIDEIEINPLVAHQQRLVPLDVLVRLTAERSSAALERPTEKLRFLLEPRSIAIVGVSRQLNPGRIILHNLWRQGFDRDRVFVVKPGEDLIEGCRCVPDLGALPERVDLLIVAVAAAQVPDLLDEVIGGRRAESVIVIPSGLEEKPGSHHSVRRLLDSLHRARGSDWRGPLVNGGNCMGIRSAPGCYDTFFVPEYKMPPAGGTDSVAALVAQSGAFLVARASKVPAIAFKYSISIGNQLDLTLGDYLHYLARDQDLQVIAVYVEGFKSLDGLRFLEAAEQIRKQGRTVVLYRAGRSDAGARAAASHTASLAGSYDTTVALARAAGVLVAESIADFEDLLEMAVLLRDRPLIGRRLAGLSNAGFECVTLSDRLGWFVGAALASDTISELREIFVRSGVDGLVEIRNPLDVTPMMGDELYAHVTEVMLADPNVDIGVVGCVPFTGALATIPADPSHEEDLLGTGAIAARLADLWRKTTLPWVTVVDGGRQYDALAGKIREAGIPTFRTMDRAMEILEKYGRWMASDPVGGEAGEGQG